MRRPFPFFALLLALCLPAQAATIYGLNFTAQNGDGGSDVALVWDGSNLLDRDNHTAIWWYSPVQQTGYYALGWHSPNGGTDTWDGGDYSFGTHPYPASDCQVDGNGLSTNPTSSGGTAHCWEIAGVGSASDWLAPAGTNPGYTVTKGPWYRQVRRVRLAASGPCSGQYEHLFIPDYLNHPTQIITHCVASIGAGGAGNAFYFGASDWRSGYGGATANDETPSGRLRGIQLYGAALSDADVATEITNWTSNTPLTASGIANVWYMNQNPRPTDVTDKSGAGHNPTWRNASRPAEWDSTYTDPVGVGFRALMGVGR